jgi:hypothetical protein
MGGASPGYGTAHPLRQVAAWQNVDHAESLALSEGHDVTARGC